MKTEKITERELFEIDYFIASESWMDESFEALPSLLKHRILIYRMFVPDFRIKHELYEERCLTLAYAIWCRYGSDLKAFKAFVKLSRESKEKIFPMIKDKRYEMSDNQIWFASAVANQLMLDFKAGVLINTPSNEDILRSVTLTLPNAFFFLEGKFLNPIREFIKKYVETL